ncbi:putative membrane protein [Clostridium bornimense]|uniref:Putative membrane protein n=1 Tax=Clostridium bornimense TaxID=1216932 RepID=W6RUH6_9CLOT|nr:DUF6382 domain-containing protein [Clostridium bornimense]CDM68306.1 putative membrane protein [Clostridium bornimense]
MDSQLIDIEKYIEKDGNKGFFVALIGPTYKLVSYEVKMIENNSSNSSLIMSISQFNEKIKLRYDIGNKISLESYLKGKNITKSEFILIAKNMVKVLNSYEELILENGIEFLDLEDIYIDIDTKEIVIIYIPINYTGEKEIVEDRLKEIIKSLYVEYVDVDFEDYTGKCDKLIQLVRDKDSTISDLYNLLSDKVEEKDLSKISNAKTITNLAVREKMNTLYNKESDSNALTEKLEEDIGAIENIKKDKKVNFKNIIAAQIIIGLVISLMYITGLLDKPYIKLFIYILILLYMLIIITSFGVKKDTKEVKEKNEIKEVDISNDTILLSSNLSEEFKCGYITLNQGGISERVVVNKASFKIGRMIGEVDLITESKAIGKIHCEIIKDDEKYYLVDLNSKNGTYLNGARLKSNNRYLLNDGDSIRLANVDGKFEIK